MGIQKDEYDYEYAARDGGVTGESLVRKLPSLIDDENWPLWVNYDREYTLADVADFPQKIEHLSRLEVAFISPRKGHVWILNAENATVEDYTEAYAIVAEFTRLRGKLNNGMRQHIVVTNIVTELLRERGPHGDDELPGFVNHYLRRD